MTTSHSTPNTSDLEAQIRDWAARELTPADLADAEQQIEEIGRRIKQAMMEVAAEQMSGKASYQGTTTPCACGANARFVWYRPRTVFTLCGEVEVRRAYYHCATCGSGHLPWDKAQGLSRPQWSPGVKAVACEVCGQLHYREASRLIERLTGMRIDESSLEAIVAEVGARARNQEEARIERHFEHGENVESAARPKRLYVEMDGTSAHTDGSWHEVKTAVVFEGKAPGIGEHPDQDRKVGGLYIARQESAEAFGRRTYMAAKEAGLDYATEVVVLGDGADWIRNQADLHFPGHTGIVDIRHADERIYKVAKALYGEENPQGQHWAKQHCETLETKGPGFFIRALKRRKTKTEEQREAVREQLHYFEKNRRRMDYPSYRARGMMIGSGPVEAACKVVVGQRVKESGMRWSYEGADVVLAIRALLLSGKHDEIATLARAA